MLIGISGSGKSTFTNQLEDDNVHILSSDEIRLQLYNTLEEGNNHNTEVFDYLHNEMKQLFINTSNDEDITVVYDATNVNRKRRQHVYKMVKAIDKSIIVDSVVVFRDPVQAKINNKNREAFRFVPENVIDQQFMSLQMPRITVDTDNIIGAGDKWFEGDCVTIGRILDNDGDRHILDLIADIAIPNVSDMVKLNFAPHDTPYHKEDINDHIKWVYAETSEKYDHLALAAAFHDVGKGFVKGKGMNTGAPGKYINHENVGAQMLMNLILFNNHGGKITTSEKHTSDCVELVQQHMAAHTVNLDNAKHRHNWKTRNALSEELITNIMNFSAIDDAMRITHINNDAQNIASEIRMDNGVFLAFIDKEL